MTGLTRRALLRRSTIAAGVVAAAPLLERVSFGAAGGTTVPGDLLSYARAR